MVNHSARRVLENASKYDIIAFQRTGFKHYAIYIGDGYVVHFGKVSGFSSSSFSSRSSNSGSEGVVRKEKLMDVAEGDECYIHNLYSAKNVLPDWKIEENIQRALNKVYRWYDVVESNCEHFVTSMKYGFENSKQVDRAMVRAPVVGWTTAAVGALAGSGAIAFTGVGIFALPLIYALKRKRN